MDVVQQGSKKALFVASLVGLLPACGPSPEEQKAAPTAAQAAPAPTTPAAQVAGKPILVNVLAKEAFQDCHIKGSINVPYEEIKAYATANWNKDTTKVIVYCANPMCSASLESAKMLVNELGFKKENVWAYEGGSAAAKYDGLPMEGACKESYLQGYEPKKFEKEVDGIQVITSEELKKMME
jgi:rhodanese-related sulfurtransferase